MDAIQIIFLPIVVFVAKPWLAVFPAALLAWLWWAKARGTSASFPTMLAFVLWSLYAMWEISFMFRPVREWIRVDLLLIGPVLLFTTLWAGIALCRNRR